MLTKFYRGYIRLGKDKGRIDKRPSRVIPQYETVGGLFKPEYMMLDFDNGEDCGLFLQLVDKYGWNTHIVGTDNGIHAIFKKPDIKIPSENGAELVCGLNCDIKQGRNSWNNSDYECIIKHGEPREIIKYCDDVQVLPWQLMRLSKKLDLKTIGEGDGRHGVHKQIINVALSYTTDAKEIIDLVQWVNDYVFKVARKSVNWHVSDLQKWIDNNIKEDLKIDDLLQQYKIDLHKLNVWVKTNFEKVNE